MPKRQKCNFDLVDPEVDSVGCLQGDCGGFAKAVAKDLRVTLTGMAERSSSRRNPGMDHLTKNSQVRSLRALVALASRANP
jgi:hypothetical protein